MKQLLFMSLMILLLTGCSKNGDPIEYEVVDGLYEGYFAYQGTSYWHVIELDSFLHNTDPAYYICNPDWLMPGEYYRRCPVREMPCPWQLFNL